MRTLTPSLQLVRMAALVLLAGCGNLTCDQQKQESIKHMNLGVEAANGQSYATAIKELERAQVLDPTNHQAAYQLGQIFVKQEQWDKAETALAAAVKYNNKDPMYHYHLGRAYLEQGKLDLARTELQAAISLNKRLYKAHYFLGRVHAAQERPKDAATSWSESCRLNPAFGKPFYELGKLYYAWDYHAEATQVLLQGAQYTRDAEDLTDIQYQMGLSYDALKQPDKAADAFQKALEAKKDNLDALYRLGMALADKGDVSGATEKLTEFTKLAGSSSGYSYSVASAYDRMNKLRRQ